MNIRLIGRLALILAFITPISWWMGRVSYTWLPVEASAEAQLIDEVFSLFVALGTAVFLGVAGTIGYCLIFNRAGKYDNSDGPPIEGNIPLEVVWTLLPIALVLFLSTYSYQHYEKMGIQGPMQVVHFHNPLGMEPAYAAESADQKPIEEIEVYARQWVWEFRYPQHNVTTTELHLPVDRRVHLTMQTEDVIHGFYIPAFRVKQDIDPNHVTELEFTPVLEGAYRLDNSQFSGTYAAVMNADVFVESLEEYDRWLADAARSTPRPATNKAFTEYARKEEQGFGGWPSIAPAPPPLVNYPTQQGRKVPSAPTTLRES
ncbi:cytochrome c oxidase subunit II [Leptolyngbya sp. AN02str]|uniref:cytochrome c oxidase subunit II n=1 Tax=Leptolyngbya sp. AN02str TaxID=3423363 RepID=UPI003D31B78E